MNSHHPPSLINLDPLREAFGNNNEGVKEIVTLFIEEVPRTLSEIRNLFEQKQWLKLRQTLHSVKVYYTYVGNLALANGLSQWERDIQSESGTQNDFLVELETKSALMVEELKAMLANASL